MTCNGLVWGCCCMPTFQCYWSLLDMTWRWLQEWSKCHQRISTKSYPVWLNAGQTPWGWPYRGALDDAGCYCAGLKLLTGMPCAVEAVPENDSVQLYIMSSGRSRYENFLRTALCRTLSKALEKSTTNGLFSRRVITVWRRWTSAAVWNQSGRLECELVTEWNEMKWNESAVIYSTFKSQESA